VAAQLKQGPIFRSSTQRERIEELVFVREGVAIVRTFDTLTGHAQALDKVIRSPKTLVVTRRVSDWNFA
jgi:hypothetical protein